MRSGRERMATADKRAGRKANEDIERGRKGGMHRSAAEDAGVEFGERGELLLLDELEL